MATKNPHIREHTAPCLLGAMAILSVSGCFYTDPINEAPIPRIRILTPGVHKVGDVVRFDATKSSDSQAGTLTATWQAFAESEGRWVSTGPAQTQGLNQEFAVPIVSHAAIQVQLRVEDEFHAVRTEPALHRIDVVNSEPTITVQANGNRDPLNQSYVLSRPIDLVATPSDPDVGDELYLRWELMPAVGSQEDQREFHSIEGDTIYRLVPDVAGLWRIHVTVEDDFGGVGTHMLDLQVGEDAPPCLGILSPKPEDEAFYVVGEPRRIAVLSVEDALDPFPGNTDELGQATFRWFLKLPGSNAFEQLPEVHHNSLVVDPTEYSPGEQLFVRVEVLDRVEGPERELPCPPDASRCALQTGSDCFQRVTWGLEIR